MIDLAALHAFVSPDKNPLFSVSISGGRDSSAASLALKEAGVDHVRVNANPGWEAGITPEYIRNVLVPALGPIDEVHGVHKDGSPMTMESLVAEKGMFPSRTRRFCTVELKVIPLKRYIARLASETGRPIVNVIGIRRAESAARRESPEVEMDDAFGIPVVIWRPLVNWSAEDVRAIHERHGLRWNPLYDMGAGRVGCWPCINASKREISLVARTDPARIQRIAAMELDAKAKAAARHAAKGGTFESLGYLEPTFFMQSGPPSERQEGKSWPIERVVDWARTSRGGKQYEMDWSDGDEGCVRYGMCEAPS